MSRLDFCLAGLRFCLHWYCKRVRTVHRKLQKVSCSLKDRKNNLSGLPGLTLVTVRLRFGRTPDGISYSRKLNTLTPCLSDGISVIQTPGILSSKGVSYSLISRCLTAEVKSATMILIGPFAWGFALLMSMNVTFRKVRTPKIQHVTDIHTFESILSSTPGPKLSGIMVTGNFSEITDDHPVVEAILSRWKINSKPGKRALGDTKKIALAIEGGGMRGCVSAGATAALNVLGIDDTIDVVYGSSAGAMIAAYFISRQSCGVQIYHDILPAAGSRFIDKGKLLFAAGLPAWVNLILRRNNQEIDEIMSFIPDSESTRIEHPRRNNDRSLTNVFNLDFLLVQVMGILQPLDWKIFTKNEASQPLKIVASSLRTMAPLVMSSEKGNFGDLASLLECIRASMSVPGITGTMMALSEKEATLSAITGEPLSVPFIVHKRRKAHHSYESSEIPSAKNTAMNGELQATQLIKASGSRMMKTKTMQGLLSFGRVAVTALLKLVIFLKGTKTQKIEDYENTLVANEIYATSDVQTVQYEKAVSDSDIITKDFRSKNIMEGNPSSNKAARSHRKVVEDCEPIVDAFLCEPLPYRSAVEDGASHVIVLRTRPDPCPVLGKGPGVFEKLIAKRFFKGYKEHGATEYMMQLNHHRIYAEDVLRLSEGSRGPKGGVNVNGQYAHLLSVAPSAGRVEVGQLETRRDKVLQGMQDGARRVFEIFGPSILGVSSAAEVEDLVQSVFPDSMLLRVVSLQDFEKSLVVQEGLDNQL